MEHRCARRYQARFDALVYCRGDLVLQGRTRNISTAGVFIELPDNRLIRNTLVDVELGSGVLSGSRKRAMVVHSDPEGVGLDVEWGRAVVIGNADLAPGDPVADPDDLRHGAYGGLLAGGLRIQSDNEVRR